MLSDEDVPIVLSTLGSRKSSCIAAALCCRQPAPGTLSCELSPFMLAGFRWGCQHPQPIAVVPFFSGLLHSCCCVHTAPPLAEFHVKSLHLLTLYPACAATSGLSISSRGAAAATLKCTAMPSAMRLLQIYDHDSVLHGADSDHSVAELCFSNCRRGLETPPTSMPIRLPPLTLPRPTHLQQHTMPTQPSPKIMLKTPPAALLLPTPTLRR